MSIAETVGKGIAWMTISTIFEKFVVLANVFLALAFLTIHEYGLVQLVLSVVSVASIALLPGFSDAITADLAVEHGRSNTGKAKEVLLQYNGLIILLSVAAWAVIFFGSSLFIGLSGGALGTHYLRIASCILLLSPIRTAINMLFTVSLKFREQSLYSIVEEVCKLIGLIIFVIWLRKGPEGLLYAIVLSQVGAILVFIPFALPFALQIIRQPGAQVGPFWKSLSRHRLWSIGNSYVGTLTSNIQIWITKLFLGTDAVAVFSVAQGLVSHVVSLLPLNIVIVPVLPRYIDKPKEFVRALRTSMKVQIISAIALIMAGAIGGPILIKLFFPKYAPSLPLYLILLLGVLASASNALLTPVFATLKRQSSYFYSSVIKLLLTIGVFGTSVYVFGLVGTAIGSVVAAAVSTIERHIRLRIIEPDYALDTHNFFSLDKEERIFTKMLINSFRQRFRWLPFTSS